VDATAIVNRGCHCDRLTPIAAMNLHKSGAARRAVWMAREWFNVYKYDLRVDRINFDGPRKVVNLILASAKGTW